MTSRPRPAYPRETTTVRLSTEAVSDLEVEWRVDGGMVRTATATSEGNGVWTFDIPASLEPVVVEWRVHLEGEGPAQTTPGSPCKARNRSSRWTKRRPTCRPSPSCS